MKNKLREFRTKKGLTQSELSNKASVSRTVICQIETGEREVVTTETMKKISNALGVKIDDIFLL
ncbi:MAG: helix-turn-helix transcriptional regulator [Christensenellales bacterium]|jgi:DNA-binding XRE family transcriptional regulator